MSHFTEVKTKLDNFERVVAAARRLGNEVLEAETQPLIAQGFMENTMEADAVIKTGYRYDIAIQKNEAGEAELVADWELLEKVGKMKQDEYVNKLKQQYSLLAIEETAEEQGLSIGETHVAADGSIEVTVNQW